MGQFVEVDFYLVIGQKTSATGINIFTDGRPTVRTCKSYPAAIEKHEIAVAMNMRLPLGLFTRPKLSASIVVPDGAAPLAITPQIESDITRVLQEQLGITLRIEAPPAQGA